MNNAERVEVTKEPIVVNIEKGIYAAEYQKKKTLSVELRQKLITLSYYPTTKTRNEMSGGLFSTEDFGFNAEPFKSEENRVAWVNVPENATMEQVTAMLEIAKKNGAEIYRVLSFHPIISADQQYAIDNGLRTIDDFANQQVMRYPQNDSTIADGTANTLIVDKTTGNAQYRKTFFWDKARKDEDKRDVTNVYVSPEIAAELLGAQTFAGQEIN